MEEIKQKPAQGRLLNHNPPKGLETVCSLWELPDLVRPVRSLDVVLLWGMTKPSSDGVVTALRNLEMNSFHYYSALQVFPFYVQHVLLVQSRLLPFFSVSRCQESLNFLLFPSGCSGIWESP